MQEDFITVNLHEVYSGEFEDDPSHYCKDLKSVHIAHECPGTIWELKQRKIT